MPSNQDGPSQNTPQPTITEAARQTPVCCEVDVCVIGGGTAGVCAAVAAARSGASTAIVEADGYFGGVATAGLVCVWHSQYDTEFRKQIIGGLPMELVERLRKYDAVMEHARSHHTSFSFPPYMLVGVLDEILGEAGVRPFLHTRFVEAVLAEPGRLDAVIIEDKTGRRAIRAKAFVDATGDGDVVHRSGLPTRKGSHLQPPTACMLVSGMDGITQANPDFSLNRAVFDPRNPEALRPGFLWNRDLPGGLTMIAGTRVHGADCSDADQLTQAEIEGRRQAMAIFRTLRRQPGGADTMLHGLPAHIGIRETRHVECCYTLREEDVLSGRRFDDAIGNGSYRVDIHHADGDGLTFRYLNGEQLVVYADGHSEASHWREPQDADPTFYQIPYRSLLPKGSANVLIAGRCIDADEGAFGAVRVMINTNQMGEAVGTAAAMAAQTDQSVSELDIPALRDQLAERGAVIL